MDPNITTFLASVVTAISTLLAVVITNYYNEKGNSKKLEFEREKIDSDRKLDLRREVYIQAAGAVVGMNTYLFSLITKPETRADAIVPNDFNSILNKIILVGDSDTAIKAKELSAKYAKLTFQIFGSLNTIVELENKIEALKHIIEKNQKEIDRILALMKECSESNNNQNSWPLLNNSYESHQKMIDDDWEECEKYYESLKAERIKAIRFVHDEISKLEMDITNLSILLRSEMHLNTNEEFVANSLREQTEELSKLLFTTLDSIQ